MLATVPAFRNKLMALLTKALARVQRAAGRRARTAQDKPDLPALSAFCHDLAHAALSSLRPDASHYRRLMALDVLATLIQCCGVCMCFPFPQCVKLLDLVPS